MSLKTPDFIPEAFASKAVGWQSIPDETNETGRASWSQGFPPETAVPEASGGIPPHRNDFQAILNAISGHTVFQQSGSLYHWDDSLDYVVGAHVLGSNNIEYICLADNGISSVVSNPVSDTERIYWTTIQMMVVDMIYPVGSIYMTMNSTSPSVLFGGSWQKIQGRYILASNNNIVAGRTGGSNDVTLTINNIPAHTHTGRTNITGSHTHDRGNMEISGSFTVDDQAWKFNPGDGAFFNTGKTSRYDAKSDADKNAIRVGFEASRTWTGITSSNGNHSHIVSIDNAGNGQSFSIMPSYIAINVWKRTA